jgi:hypothetical protein
MDDRPHSDTPEHDVDIVPVDPHAEALDVEEAHAFAGAAIWAVPVGLAHLAVIYLILSAVTGFKLPAFLRSDAVFAWLWINGAALGLGIWSWKNGRVPVAAGKWMTGRRAKLAILAWLGLSLLWFLLPGLLGDLWRGLTSPLGGW